MMLSPSSAAARRSTLSSPFRRTSFFLQTLQVLMLPPLPQQQQQHHLRFRKRSAYCRPGLPACVQMAPPACVSPSTRRSKARSLPAWRWQFAPLQARVMLRHPCTPVIFCNNLSRRSLHQRHIAPGQLAGPSSCFERGVLVIYIPSAHELLRPVVEFYGESSGSIDIFAVIYTHDDDGTRKQQQQQQQQQPVAALAAVHPSPSSCRHKLHARLQPHQVA